MIRVEPSDTPLRRGYAVCTEPRSGSNYFCEILASTGVLGKPLEYFNAHSLRTQFGVTDYPADPELQLAALRRLAATPNGVYGLKLFAQFFDSSIATGWPERLPNLHFIHLVRHDILGQAISLVRANQTQKWRGPEENAQDPPAHASDAVPLKYDFRAINFAVKHLMHCQNRWRYYFACNKVPVLHLSYEQVCEDPQGTVEQVGQLIGLETIPRVDRAEIRITVQRDALTQEWRDRYQEEAGALTVFD
jgi:LPS sulfotransferase NodH